MIIEVNVSNKIARLADKNTVAVCENSDYVIHFNFDEEWAKFETKTARFKWGGKYTDVVFTGNECAMPIVNNVYSVKIGVYAGDLHTTTSALLMMKKSIRCGNEPESSASQEVRNEFLDVLDKRTGDLSALKTTSKDNLVAAINEAAASGGADWNQNDPTAKDYVKNRTHYRSIEQATMTVSAGLGAALVDIVPFAPGDVVDITVNGKEMSLTAASDVLQEPSGQSRSLTYVGDSPSSIVSGAAPVYGWTVALLDGMCMAQTYGNDCTFGYTAYVYTRLPIEYSPIIVETDVGSSSVFVPVSKIKIDGSINVAKRIFIDADMDGKGNAEIEIKGELGGYSYMEYVLLSRGIYVAKYDSNTFILKHENLIVTNLKEYLNDWRQKKCEISVGRG